MAFLLKRTTEELDRRRKQSQPQYPNSGLHLSFESENRRQAYIRMIDRINALDETSQPLLGPSRKRRTSKTSSDSSPSQPKYPDDHIIAMAGVSGRKIAKRGYYGQ